MTADRDARLIDLAAALSDGAPIDWDVAESTAATDSERAQIRRMRLVHDVTHSSLDSAGAVTSQAVHESLLHPPSASADGEDPAPVTWGPLRVIEKIGRGRFGDVYRAWDPRLDREVALKLLRRRESDASVGSTFVEEGRLLAKIRHPNVVTVYGAERIDERVGVWMELIGGRTLEDELTERGPLPVTAVAAIGAEVCRALGAVHRAGLVHRDVKAQNVMRDKDGRLVLMDFGTGRELDAASPPELAGTPLYLAPEVLTGGVATPQSDLYSLGVLLYHLATGSFPVRGRTLREVRAIHERGGHVPIRHARPDIPKSFEAVVARLLAVDPAARPSDANSVAAAMIRLSGRPRGRLLPWTLAASVVLVAGSAAWVWRHQFLPSRVAASTERKVCDDCGTASASIAGDGRSMVFADDPSDDLAVRDLVTLQTSRLRINRGGLNGPEGVSAPVLSRDGRSVVYVWYMPDGSIQVRVAPKRVEGVGRVVFQEVDVAAKPVAWFPSDDAILVEVTARDRTTRLVWVKVADGAKVDLKAFGWRLLPDSRPALSPDGRFIAYAAVPTNPSKAPGGDPSGAPLRSSLKDSRIYVMSADGRNEAEVTRTPNANSAPIWTSDGERLLYLSDVSGGLDLWAIRMRDGAPTGNPSLVKKDIGPIVPLGVTNDGVFYYYAEHPGIRQTSITAFPADDRGADTATSTIVGSHPTWSPDGRSLAVVRPRPPTGDAVDIVVHSFETGRDVPYSHDLIGTGPVLWYSDSKALLALVGDQTRGAWNRVDLGDGTFQSVAVNRSDPNNWTHWGIKALSPDGNTLYFGAYADQNAGSVIDRIVAETLDGRPSSFRQVFRFSGAADSPPVIAGDAALAAAPDGRTLALVVHDPRTKQARLSIVGVDGRNYRELTPPFLAQYSVRDRLAWARDGRFIYFTVAAPNLRGTFRVMRVSPKGGAPAFTGLDIEGLDSFDVSPDGSRIAFCTTMSVGKRDEVWAMAIR